MNKELMGIFEEGLSIGGSTIASIVGVMLTSMFTSKNAEKSELVKIKAGKFGAVLNELYDSGKITLKQYLGCNNFLKIAKLADKYLRNNDNENVNKNYENYSFEWFMKFYDYAEYINDDTARKLWAAILASEIENPNSIPLSLLHTLSIMDKEQAKFFCNISRFVFLDYKDSSPHLLIFVSSSRTAYLNSRITPADLRDLERLGLVECDFNHEYIFKNKKMFKTGNNVITVYGDPENENKIKAGNVNFTKNGKILYSIIDDSNKRYRADIVDYTINKFKLRNCSVVINEREMF